MATTTQKSRITRAVVEVLEQRVLYSADGPFDLLILNEKPLIESDATSFTTASSDNNQRTLQSPDNSTAVDHIANADQSPDSSRTEIVFIALDTPDAATLANDIQQHASNDIQFHFVTIDPGHNGIDVISETLAKHAAVDAVHIISHGDDGRIQLGSQVLDSVSLVEHEAAIKEWRSILRDDADILIYGCDVAATATGQQFVAELAKVTGADVAASNDLTGHDTLGGDWTLEHIHGTVDSQIALSSNLQNDWHGTLDITSNLVAHYRFADAGGTIAIDSVGSEDAFLSNGATFTSQGRLNDALTVSADLSGDALATIPNAPEFDFGTNDFTVAFWFNTDSLANQIIFHHDDINDGHYISTTAAGQLVWSIDGSLTTSNVVVPGLAAKTWYHVTAMRSGDTFQLISWDGSTTASQAVTNALGSLSTTSDVLIGAFNGVEFDGRLDDLRIYNGRALSNADINELHNHTEPLENAPTDLSSGIELNTDGGNDVFFSAIAAEPVFANAVQRTVEINLQIDSAAGTNPHFLTYWTSSQLAEFEIALSTSNEITVTIGGITYTGAVHPELRDGDIHQIAVSWDNADGEVVIYVDGQFSSSANVASGYVLGATGALDIGQGQTPAGKLPSEAFAGTFYDFRVWNEIRSASDIALSFQRKLDPNDLPATLIANFQFDGFDSANIIRDKTSVSNGLSIQHASGAGFINSTPVGDLNIDENPANGTRIGYIVPTDPDAQANFTFDLTDNPGGNFAIDNATGEISVANGSGFNYESGTSNNLTIEVTDASSRKYSEIISVIVNDVNEAPTVNNAGGFVNEGQFVTITPAMIQATDVDAADGAGDLTYTLSNITNGQVEISGAPGNPITTFTQAQINSGQIVFMHDGGDTTAAGFDYSLADGLEDGVTPLNGTFSFTVSNSNDTPFFSDLDNSPTFIEDASAVVLDSDVTIFDSELSSTNNFSGSTVYVGRSGGAVGEDMFSTTGLLSPMVEGSDLVYNGVVIGTVNKNSGGEVVLMFNSSASNPVVNGVLQSIAYSNTSDTPPSGVSLNLTFNDNNLGAQGTGGAKWDADSLLVTITQSNDAPNVDLDADNSSAAGLSFETTFTEDAGAILVADSDALLTDADDTQLTSLQVLIVNQLDGTDEWLWANIGVSGITLNYNTGTGLLTLSGPASVADYQQVLRTVTYQNNSDNPDTTQRLLNIVANDSNDSSLVAQSRINIVTTNDAPVVDLDTDDSTASGIDYHGSFIRGNGAVAIADSDTSIIDDDSPTLTSLSVSVTNLLDGTDENLSVTLPNGSWASFYDNTIGKLDIVAGVSSTLTEWENVIESIQYNNVSATPDPTTRIIELTGSDGIAANFPVTRSEIAVSLNAAPVINTTSPFALELTEDDDPVAADVGITVIDSDSPTLSSAVVAISSNYKPGEDFLTFANQPAINGSWNAANGTMSLTGVSSVANYENALRSVQIANTSQAPNPATREVSWTVNDGLNDSNTLTRNVDITSVNDSPTFNSVPDNTGQIVDSGITGATSTSVADIDGDGNLDLVTTSSSTGRIVLYHGDGTGNFGPGTVITNTLDEPQEVAVADLNNDGDADIVAADYSTTQDNLVIYSNNGNGNFTPSILDTATGGVVQVDTGDLDGDGDIDVVANFWFSSEVVWYENLGGGTFDRSVIDTDAGGTAIEVADVNLDGEADVIATFRNSNTIVYYQNDGGATSFTANSSAASQAFDVAAADFDNDGDIDLGYVGLTGAVGWLENDGGVNPAFTHNDITNVGRSVQITATDIDNDGDADLLLTRDSASEYILLSNDGGGAFSQTTFATASSAREIVAADLDSDGYTDVITSSASTADVQVFINYGNGKFTNYVTNEDTAVTLDPISFTDVDAGTSPLQATTNSANGTISLSDTSGLSFTTGDGIDDTSMVFTGTATSINSALSAIEFQPHPNINGATTVAIAINDQGNTGNGGPLTTATSMIIDVLPVNDSPVLENNTGATISINETLTLTPAMLREGDPDHDGADLTFTVVTAPLEGYLALTSAPATPVSVFSQDDIDNGRVIYVHTGTTTSNDSFALELADDGTDGSTPASGIFTITLTGVLADNYVTDEDTPLLIPAITGVLTNDAQGAPVADSLIALFRSSSDTDGDTTWRNDVGADDLNLGSGISHTTSPPSPPDGINAAFALDGSGGITGPALHGFSTIDGTASATLETWIRFDALNSHQVIFDTGNSADTGISVIASGNGIELSVSNGGQLTSSFGGSLLTPDTWHHIVLTVDMDAGTPVVQVWIDGSLEVQVTRALSNWAPGAFGLGTVNGTTVGGYSGNVDGYIASLRVHNKVLDSTAISLYYNNPGADSSSPFVTASDSTGTNGLVSINADGSFSYDPNNQFETLASGQSTTDTFTYTYDDGNGATEAGTVTITVNGVNDAPVISNITGDSLAYSENDPASIIDSGNDALVNDIDNADFNGAVLTAAITTGANPAEDVLSIRNTGAGAGQIGYVTGTLSYGGVVVGTVSGGTAGVPLTITFNNNATATSATATLRNITYRNSETVSPSTDTRIVEFKLSDTESAVTANQPASISVTAVNELPITDNATASVREEDRNKMQITVSGSDIDGTVENIQVTSLPANGTLYENASTSNEVTVNTDYPTTAQSRFFYFAPDADWNGTTSFTYAARDNDGGSDLTDATGTFIVYEVNDPPVRTTGSVTPLIVAENSGTTSLGLESLAYSTGGGSDELAQTLTYTVTEVPDATLGTIVLADGTTPVVTGSTYTLPQLQAMQFNAATDAFGGPVSFSFSVTDNGSTDGVTDPMSTNETLSVTVYRVNDDPVVTANNFVIQEGGTMTLSASSLAATDTDTAAADLAFAVSNATGGQFVATSAPLTTMFSFTQAQVTAGQVQFIHDGGEQAPAFTITLSDSDGASSSVAGNISFTNINDNPSNSGTLPSFVTVLEDIRTSVDTSTVTIADPDAAMGNMALSISTSGGTLLAAYTSGIVINGNLSDNLLLTGTVASLNNWLSSSSSLSFTGAPNANGALADSITFTIVDNGNSGTGGGTPVSLGSIDININAVNDAPVGTDNTVITDEDTDFVFAPADFGFSDGNDGDLFQSVTIDTLPANGELLLNGAAIAQGTSVEAEDILDNELTFRPTANEFGERYSEFWFRVQDDGGTSNGGSDRDGTTRTMAVDVTSVNDAPGGADKLITSSEDTDYVFTVGDFGFTDIEGDNLLAVIIDSTPVNGRLLLNNAPVADNSTVTAADIATGRLVFQPTTNDSGSAYANLSFRVQDDGGNDNGGVDTDTTPQTISIDISAVNDAPGGASNSISLPEDTNHTFTIGDFGFEDPADGHTISAVNIDMLPVNGYLLLNGTPLIAASSVSAAAIDAGELVFSPGSQEYGSPYASFTFRLQDNGGTSNGGTDTDSISRTLTIDVTAVNDAPFGSDSVAQTLEDTAYTLSRSDFGFFDSNDPADQLSAIQIESLPARGQLLLNSAELIVGSVIAASDIDAAQLIYVPTHNESGNTSFEFRVIDDNEHTGQAISQAINQLTITISPVSDSPSGTDTGRAVLEDNSYSFTTADFGFSDPADGDTLTGVYIDVLPANGTLTLSGDTVNSSAFVTENEIASGQLVYRPEPDAHGNNYASLGFRVADSGTNGPLNTDTTIRMLNFDVVGVNDAPGGENNTISTMEDTDYAFSRNDFGFSDPADSDALSYLTITSLPEVGTLLNRGIPVSTGETVGVDALDTGTLVYRPPLNTTGTFHNGFSFTVTDNGGVAFGGEDTDSSANVISINLPGVNDSPLIITNGASLNEGSTVVIDNTMLGGTDADDTGPEDLTLTITTLPAHGLLLLNGVAISAGASFTLATLEAGALSYHHNASETSVDGFDVSLADGGEDGSMPAPGRFDLTINEVIDEAVQLSPDSLNLEHSGSFKSVDGDKLESGYSTLSNGSLINNTEFLVELELAPAHGSVELFTDGTFTYIHNGSNVLVDEFSYRVTNEDGIFSIATVTVTIAPPIAGALDEIPEEYPDDQVQYVEHLTEPPERTVVQPGTDVVAGGTATTENSTADLISSLAFQYVAAGAEEARRTATLSEAVARQIQETRASDAESAIHRQLGVKQHREQGIVTIDNELQLVSTATFDLIVELNVPSLKQATSNPGFLQGLAQLDNEFDEMEKQNGSRYKLAEETLLGVSFSITVGMLAWAVRGGALVASVMAFAPMWSVMDLGRLISVEEEKKKESEKVAPSEEDVRIEELFEKEE